MTIDYLMYASRLKTPMGYDALKGLLDTSQRNNSAAGLTGFLHIEGRVVLQYLEGPSDTLSETVARIQQDPRHEDMAVLAEGQIKRRSFADWKMALVECTTLSLFDLLGTQCTDIPDVARVNPSDLITLLSANASFLRHQPSVIA